MSLEETLNRHKTKPNAHEFGEKEMKEWYKHRDLTNFDGEVIIPESFTMQQTVAQIAKQCRLA